MANGTQNNHVSIRRQRWLAHARFRKNTYAVEYACVFFCLNFSEYVLHAFEYNTKMQNDSKVDLKTRNDYLVTYVFWTVPEDRCQRLFCCAKQRTAGKFVDSRSTLEMSTACLKRATSISTASIAKLDKGENVTIDILIKICEALDCELHDIVELSCDDNCTKTSGSNSTDNQEEFSNSGGN